MPVEHHRGNLLTSPCTVIAHGCNCFCTMEGGIARAIRGKYPGAYTADCKTSYGDINKLGTFTMCKAEDCKIYNLYTQFRYGTDRVQLDYEALADALALMKFDLDLQDPNHQETVGMPRIGCGLAGGDWEQVEDLINDTFLNRTIRIYTL